MASVKAAVEDTAEVRVKVVAEDTALLNVHRPPAPRLSSCSRSFLRWNWRIRRKTRIISGRSWWGTKWGYGGSSGAAPVHVHVHSAPAPTHPHPIQSSPYGGGHGGGNQSGGYGGSAGGHASAPISQSYQQPAPVAQSHHQPIPTSSYGGGSQSGGYGGSAGGHAPAPILHHQPAPVAQSHHQPTSPYGGNEGGSQSGGYGGSAGGHAPAPISQSYQQPSPVPNRFLLMEGNKEDRQEDTLLPLPTSQLQLLLMVLLLSLLKVIRTSHFSSRKIN